MNGTNTGWLAAVLIGGLFVLGPQVETARAQQDPNELARRQRLTKEDFDKLTAEMLKVAEEIEAKEPDSSKVLREAVRRARGAYEISRDMDQVADYLLKDLMELASRKQSDVIEKLQKVLALLREGLLDVDRRSENLKEMERIRQEIDKMIAAQAKLEKTSRLQDKAAEIDRAMADVDKRIADLIAAQEKLLDETKKLPDGDKGAKDLANLRDKIAELIGLQEQVTAATAGADARKLPVLGEAQNQLGEQAKAVQKALTDAAKDPNVAKTIAQAGADPNALSTAAGKTGEASGEMKKAGESLVASKPDAAADPQAKAFDALKAAHKAVSESAAKATAGTPAGKTGEAQSKLAEQTQSVADDAKKAAEQAGAQPPNLPAAADQMNKAAGKLAGQDPSKATPHQEKAIQELKEKREQLAELRRKTKDELAKPIPTQADEQKELAGQAQKTSEQMKADRPAPMPGQDSMQQASKSMDKAAGKLGESKCGDANKDQNDALDKLKKAQEDLDKAIAKESEDLQNESLAKIDAMLETILKKQHEVSTDTSGTFSRRGADGYVRDDQIKLSQLSTGQKGLGEETAKVEALLAKEGTTTVFPHVLQEVRADMDNVSKLLSEQEAGPLTQEIQAGIERNLRQMIDAIRKELSDRKRKGTGGRTEPGQGGCKSPLVPPVAELKMLLMLQKDINGRTTVLADQKAQNKLPADQVVSQHGKLADREKKVETMAKTIKAKLAAGAGGGPGGDQ